jgi:hypothetical protein
MLQLFWYLICILAPFTLANVEKVIFVTPEAQDFTHDASLDNLLLERLTSTNSPLRTYVNATFPTGNSPKGTETWLLLEDLAPNQRHEVRICWLATQPTSFWLYTHTMAEVFSDPTLLSAVTNYSNRRRSSISSVELDEFRSRGGQRALSADKPTTFLFLQIHAAADYFSLNEDLMKNVPPVHADIILDPYLLNIFPQSLVPTAVYIVIIVIIGWFLSGWTYSNLIRPLLNDETENSKKAA